MGITRTTYDVAFQDPAAPGRILETEVEVWKCDELRAEMEGRKINLRGPVVDTGGKQVSDLGDHLNSDALKVWAALVRTAQYTGKAHEFRLRDVVEFKKRGESDVDPTQPDTSTESDLDAPPSSDPLTSGSTPS